MRLFIDLPTLRSIITIMESYEIDYCKILNEPYMSLSIEKISKSHDDLIQYSFAHYYEENGDLIADPEMVFSIKNIDDKLYFRPESFSMPALSIYKEYFDWDNMKIKKSLFTHGCRFAKQ